jgi:hypothetical protein
VNNGEYLSYDVERFLTKLI